MNNNKIFSDWVMGVALTIIFLIIILSDSLDFTRSIEMKSYDLRAKIAASEQRSPDIELVVITDDDITELGRWPWPRSVIAQCIDNLHEAGAKVIALNIFFSEPEENAGLLAINRLKKEFDKLELAQKGNGLSFYQIMAEEEKNLDNDSKLEKSIKKAGNVVFPFVFDVKSSGRDKTAPAFIVKHSYKNVEGLNDETSNYGISWLKKITPPLQRFADASAGVGHNSLFADREDGHIRKQIHAIGYLEDIYVPSYAINIVKLFMGLNDNNITLSLGDENGWYIDLKTTPASGIRVPLMEYRGGTLINWNKGPEIAFRHTSFSKVLKKEIQMDIFKDKIVIIGHIAQGIGIQYVTPVSGQMPDVEVLANTVDNILNQKFYYKPLWTDYVMFGALIFFGLYISFVLPKLKAGMGAAATLSLFLVYGIGGSVVFFSGNIWLEITPPLILLVIGYILIVSKRFLVTERTKEKVEADSVETNKMLGLSFQQQGMLDLALDKFRKIPVEEEGAKELLYNLGLDFERKRQFSKAMSTYNLIIGDGKNYKDLDERIPRLKGAEETMIFSGGSSHPGDIGATLVNTDTKPTLGRYEVIDELGRGAMGIVYKGEDPKIHRTVAIKTVRISDFDDNMADEMKERFFREAESAGLLTHPNIVTIYDAGEEHDLAYIAMEFLEGKDLEEHTKKGNLLPVRRILSIVLQAADALEYAHGKGIVHRDIKPANIMKLDETGEIKVTDFGIARITASSKTKTGVIMGTPSYMSPEQVSGQKVDGRSDIFSLGVVLFELLCGEKPFKGEDMTTMMFKIAKEKHPSVKAINPKIPGVIEKVIDKALEKDVNKRYQKAGQLAEHLKIILRKIDEATNRKKQKDNQANS